MRLHLKVVSLVAFLSLALGISSYVLASRALVGAVEREVEARAVLLARALADRVVNAVIDGARVQVDEALTDLSREGGDVAYAYVVGFDGRVIGHTFRAGFPRAFLPRAATPVTAVRAARITTERGRILEVSCPLISGMPAQVRVGLERDQAHTAAVRLRRRLLTFQGLLAASCVGAAVMLSRRVTRPLEVLAESMDRFGAGLGSGRTAPAGGGPEVDALQKAFERMAAERTQDREALSAEKERLGVTLQSIGDGVIASDAEGRIALLNPVAEALTGWPAAEAVGRPMAEVFRIVGETDHLPLPSPVDAVLQTGRVAALANHTVLLGRDGAERFIADSAAPIRDGGGRLIGVVLVFRDVTDRKRADEELQRAERLESVGLLAGGIAHDFNNLLTAILGNASLCAALAPPAGTLAERMRDIERAAERASDLTGQLLTFARGGAPVRKVASVGDLIRDCTTFALRGSGVRPLLAVAPDLWAAAVDAGQIGRVVHNLVINAAQAMPSGGEVEVAATNVLLADGEQPSLAGGRYVHLRVTDGGCGIAPADLPRVFDPYFTTKQAGTGLGLATAYSIVTGHGGRIALSSRLGEGTRVDVFLPASAQEPEAPGRRRTASPAAGGRILVMDDEPLVRDVVVNLLAHLGYEAVATGDGRAAVEAYGQALGQGEGFAAVILDLTVPGGMGGREALRLLREIDPGVRAVVSSGYSADAAMAHPDRHGFCGVVSKPFRLAQLAEELTRVLGEG